jgi:hypothetical protein
MSEEIKSEDTNEVVAEPAIEVEVQEPAPQKTEKSKYAEPIPVDLNAYLDSLPQPAGPEVVGTGITDEVSLRAVVFKNIHARRSLSVHHLQRRLAELGYVQAKQDKDGYFGDNTLNAITAFQQAKGLSITGSSLDTTTFEAIFKDDPNVTIIS